MKINRSRFHIGDVVCVVSREELIKTPFAVRYMLEYADREGIVVTRNDNQPIVRVAFCENGSVLPVDSGWWFHDSALISSDEDQPFVTADQMDSMY